MTAVGEPATRLDGRAWFATASGLSASLVAIGLARFAYTPLVPPLIAAHWFPASDVVALAAANFAGYLAGALIGQPLAQRFSSPSVLRLMMIVATAAFFACAWPVSITWYFAWRFLSGLSGGAIMVLVATSILPHIPAGRRGLVGGIIFLGVGLGIAASGTLVPALLRLGLRETWLGLGAVSLALTAVSWFGWPGRHRPAAAVAPARLRESVELRVLYGEYALNALGLVPVMMLLADYVARGLGRGIDAGAMTWVLYGAGSIAGPVLCGQLGDRIGFGRGYRLVLLGQAAGLVALAVSGHPAVVAIAAAAVGAFTPGIAPLVLGRIQELSAGNPDGQRLGWSRATIAFALFQALGGYGYAFLFAHSGENYAAVFCCGAAALLIAAIADQLVAFSQRP
ncbi:MAG: YbfB/YjiJ family MFS transporter [Alphaproteobacteria bacterium]|jgi:predicted MFS family arabinose efflux permease|nr:YbfB/YjiJ family MFS transporter [Alphaproteobacteria bacterium]